MLSKNKSVEPFRIHRAKVLEDRLLDEYDRYSTLDGYVEAEIRPVTIPLSSGVLRSLL